MPAHNIKPDAPNAEARREAHGFDDRPNADLRVAGFNDLAVPSPAHELNAKLAAALAPPAANRRWPLAVSVPLWFASSGLLWWAIISAVGALLRH